MSFSVESSLESNLMSWIKWSVITYEKRFKDVGHNESWVTVLIHDVIDVTLRIVIHRLVRFLQDFFDMLASLVVDTDL